MTDKKALVRLFVLWTAFYSCSAPLYAQLGARNAETEYQVIRRVFLSGDYSKVELLAQEYLAKNPRGREAGDVLYLYAVTLLKLDRGAEARERLKELEQLAADTERKAGASVLIGDSYYYEGNPVRAYESYKETAAKYPVSDQKEYLQQRLLELSSEFGYTQTGSSRNFSPARASLTEMAYYGVQVGSFKKPKNADQLIRKLSRQGYDAYLADDRSRGMHRVRVGRFSSREEAVKWETKLRREGYSTKIIP